MRTQQQVWVEVDTACDLDDRILGTVEHHYGGLYRWRCARCDATSLPFDGETARLDALIALCEHRLLRGPEPCEANAQRPPDDAEGCSVHDDDDVIPLAEQQSNLLPYIGYVAAGIVPSHDPHLYNRVMMRVAERLQEGFEVYGDALFRMTHDEVMTEYVDELADAAIYRARAEAIRNDR